MKISTVIFDFGCVLSEVPTPADFEPIRAALGVDGAKFDEIYWRNRDAYDLASQPTETYWQEVGKMAGRELTAEEALQIADLDCALWSRMNPAMLNWVDELRQGGTKVAIISNMSAHIGEHLRRNAAWLAHFDPICLSAELNLLKPDPAIYEDCLAKIAAAPNQSLFIDDREVNIVAARKLGMNGIVFSTIAQLRRDLEPFGLADSLPRSD